MQEIWKDIKGYENKYQVSNLGRVRSLERIVKSKNRYTGEPFDRKIKGKILKPGRYTKSGHVSVVLGRNQNGSPVHQLVMKTFAGEPPAGMEVLHINGNSSDNRLSNLRYGTRTENILDVYKLGGVWRKLSIEDVYQIRFEILCGLTGKDISKKHNISESTVSCIKRGDTFSWLK